VCPIHSRQRSGKSLPWGRLRVSFQCLASSSTISLWHRNVASTSFLNFFSYSSYFHMVFSRIVELLLWFVDDPLRRWSTTSLQEEGPRCRRSWRSKSSTAWGAEQSGAERSSRIESAPGCGREEEKNSWNLLKSELMWSKWSKWSKRSKWSKWSKWSYFITISSCLADLFTLATQVHIDASCVRLRSFAEKQGFEH